MMRKNIGLLVGLSCIALAVHAAEPPDRMHYQGVLRDASDNPLSGSYDMVFRFFSGQINELLVDEHLAAGTGAVTVDGGLFSVALGSGNVYDGIGLGTFNTLTDVVGQAFAPIFLEVEVAGEVLSPRIEIVSAGFALNAGQLDGVQGLQFLRSDANDNVDGALSFLASPGGNGVCDGPVCIDPTSAGADHTLLGVAVGGSEKFRVDADGDAAVNGAQSTQGNASVGGALSTAGAASVNGELNAMEDANVLGVLSAFGDASVGGVLTAMGDANVSGALTVGAGATVSGNLLIQGGGLGFPDGSFQTSAPTVRNLITGFVDAREPVHESRAGAWHPR